MSTSKSDRSETLSARADWESALELPLFPLHGVLFPETTLPIHVFEPRYRELVGRCLAHDETFGIVLIDEGDEVGGPAVPRKIGTEAAIIASQRHPDGRYDIVVEGLRRFEILALDGSRPVLRADVRFLKDEENDADLEAAQAVAKLTEGLIASLELAGEAVIDETWKAVSPTALSYRLAAIVPVSLESRQELLEMPTAAQRLRREARLLIDATKIDARAGAS
jgi:uncharacterized protein